LGCPGFTYRLCLEIGTFGGGSGAGEPEELIEGKRRLE